MRYEVTNRFTGEVQFTADIDCNDNAKALVKLRACKGRVRVKPLVWEHHPAGKIAAPPTGHAYIIDTRTKGRCYSIKGFNPERQFDSLAEAKAAAQADYETRILAALEPASEARAEKEALEAAGFVRLPTLWVYPEEAAKIYQIAKPHKDIVQGIKKQVRKNRAKSAEDT
jgi:hypothetical protein